MNADKPLISIRLDPQRGGYLASCTCGWEQKRPVYYKAQAREHGDRHLVEVHGQEPRKPKK